MFDLQFGPYDEFALFDNYAIAMKNKKTIYSIFYDQFRKNIVPPSFEMPIYNDLETEEQGSTFDAITFWDVSG